MPTACSRRPRPSRCRLTRSSLRAFWPSAEVGAFGVLQRLRRIGCEASQPSAVVSLGLRPWSAPFLSVSPRDLEPAGSSQIEPKHSWRGWGWINAAIFLLLLELNRIPNNELFFYHGGKSSRLPFNGCQDEFSRTSARGGVSLPAGRSHTPSFERFLTAVFSAQHMILVLGVIVIRGA